MTTSRGPLATEGNGESVRLDQWERLELIRALKDAAQGGIFWSRVNSEKKSLRRKPMRNSWNGLGKVFFLDLLQGFK